MALPTLEKTWQFNVNQAHNFQGSLQACGRNAVFQLFTALKNNGWVVKSSSNGSTASATDLWTSTTALNWNSTANSIRSWVVLRNPAFGSYEICLDLFNVLTNWNGINYGALSIYAVRGGYLTTSLSTSSRPGVATVGDAEMTIISAIDYSVWFNATGGGNPHADQAIVLNTVSSTDNKSFRFFVYNGDYLAFFLMIEQAGNPISVWTAASPESQVIAWAGIRGSTTSHVDIGGSVWGNGVIQTRIGSLNTGLRTSVESYYTGSVNAWVTQGIANDQTGEYPMIPMGLVCTTAPYRMRLGNVVDMWHSAVGLPAGSTFPADGSRQFLQLGNVFIPWGTSGSPGPLLKTRY